MKTEFNVLYYLINRHTVKIVTCRVIQIFNSQLVTVVIECAFNLRDKDA